LYLGNEITFSKKQNMGSGRSVSFASRKKVAKPSGFALSILS